MKHVLVVEHEPWTRRRLCQALERNGVHAYGAATAREAFRSVRQNRPAGVILNLLLPDPEGLEAFCLLREEMPTIAFHAQEPGWPLHLPVPSDSEPVLRTQELLECLETMGANRDAGEVVAQVKWGVA